MEQMMKIILLNAEHLYRYFSFIMYIFMDILLCHIVIGHKTHESQQCLKEYSRLTKSKF